MKISSKLEICNLALLRINQNSISSYEEDASVAGQFCRLVYEQSKSYLLSQYNWTFAISRAVLNKIYDGQNYNEASIEYANRYALPDGFLRLIAVYDAFNHPLVSTTHMKPPFVLEGGYILTNQDSCKIKYVRDIDSVSEFSPMFIDCFTLDLAIRLTKLFNDSTSYLQQLSIDFQNQIEKAKISDCQQTMLSGIQSYPILYSTWEF